MEAEGEDKACVGTEDEMWAGTNGARAKVLERVLMRAGTG